MKIHHYQTKIYESILNFEHGISSTQECIYIPNQALIGFRKNQMDFFLNDLELIKERLEDSVYIGEIEFPDELIDNIIKNGITINQAKKDFNSSLLDLMAFWNSQNS